MLAQRLSQISCDREHFAKALPPYEEALQKSGYTRRIEYIDNPGSKKKCRKRNIVWFNPPYSEHVSNNIGKEFFNLLARHFPPHHRLYKMCNRNNVKLSYSCMPNMASIISRHNRKLLDNEDNGHRTTPPCNCKIKSNCPLGGSCRESSIVYRATVTSTNDHAKHYYGCCGTDFKSRFYNHSHTFRQRNKINSTELSKAVWHARDKGDQPQIAWSIVKRAPSYACGGRNCDLCLTEKLTILQADQRTTLNKRSELTGKCRHKNKFKLANFKGLQPTPD